MIVLAHQGGWDEVLLFAVVGLVAVAALRAAERRARRRQRRSGDGLPTAGVVKRHKNGIDGDEGKDQTGG
ncbi:MAG TPA: hypothetical protein VJ398_09685 [Acidimicrobiia bacterium]|nr:hypothetical protein [Acidimicrobiia bacterium]